RSAIRSALRDSDGTSIVKELTTLPGTMCHVPSHILGQELYKKYESVDEALSHCTEECSSGCTHGIIGEAFVEVPGIKTSLDDLEHPDLPLIDKFGKTFCERSSEACHGVGH